MGTKIIAISRRIDEASEVIQAIWVDNYGISQTHSEEIYKKFMEPYFAKLIEGIHVVIEYPYVDRVYRDTYYSYYSSKLEQYHRDTIRLSFFKGPVTQDDFRTKEAKEQFEKDNSYLGFLVLRPTFPKVIGRTGLSPLAKKENGFICCLTKLMATVDSVKFTVSCFPHASQDQQAMTCAETTIWGLLEYFGNKYPDYKPALPSFIQEVIQKYSYKRVMPSDGLTAEQVTYAVRELGFGAMIYSRVQYPDSFDSIISMYIESGIPVIAVMKNDDFAHAVNIIGREKEDVERVLNSNIKTLEDGLDRKIEIIDFNSVDRRYVFMDDNHVPYQLTNLTEPCKEYYTDERWHNCSIKSIIVPLYKKIYLDAVRAKFNFEQYLKSPEFGVRDTGVRVVNVFLASSRTYKEYLALNSALDIKLKGLLTSIPMPKFIWVAEISKRDSFRIGLIDGIILQDATEPLRQNEIGKFGNLSLIAGYVDGLFFTENFGIFTQVNIFADPFFGFTDNLH